MAIRVMPRQPTVRGRLYPRYDRDAGILIAESRVPREWPYGVNVDGNLIMDIDADRILANFDLHIPAHRWKVSTLPTMRHREGDADLEFLPETIETQSYDLGMSVTTNHTRSLVFIAFGPSLETCNCFGLSERCMFFTRDDELMGFLVLLNWESNLSSHATCGSIPRSLPHSRYELPGVKLVVEPPGRISAPHLAALPTTPQARESAPPHPHPVARHGHQLAGGLPAAGASRDAATRVATGVHIHASVGRCHPPAQRRWAAPSATPLGPCAHRWEPSCPSALPASSAIPRAG